MIRNVDVIAVALLLASFAVYSCILSAIRAHTVGFTHYTRTIIVPPAPPAPVIPPPVRFMRD